MKLTFVTNVFWKDKRLQFSETETDEIKMRRNRAIEVARTYEHQLTENGAIFFPDSTRSLKVILEPDRCGCTCPDIRNRRIPCKHVFATAYLLGDTSAILEVAPAIVRAPSDQTSRRKSRFQDIKVGKYFTLLDFLISDTAIKHGIPNYFDISSESGAKAIALMNLLCSSLLDPLCDKFNRISITRGYLGRELYKHIYRAENYPEGALAHGFAKNAGADILVHSWSEDALKLALHIQADPIYSFDFIRTYPGSPILCVGVDPFRQRRIIQEWQEGFRGSKIHQPSGVLRHGHLGQQKLFD